MLPFQIDAFHLLVNWRPVEDAVSRWLLGREHKLNPASSSVRLPA
jgi:hypothetical protein